MENPRPRERFKERHACVSVIMSVAAIDGIDAAISECDTRSSFIRAAVEEKLRREGPV